MKTKLSILATAVLLASALALQAQNNTYTGANNSSWATNSNWDLNLVPTSDHDVFSNNGTAVRILDVDAVAKTVTVGGASGTSRVSLWPNTGNSSLTVSGNITMAPDAGTAVLEFRGNSTLTVNGGNGSIVRGAGNGTIDFTVNTGFDNSLGLTTATLDNINMAQASNGTFTITSGQTYNVSDLIRLNNNPALVGGNPIAGTTGILNVNGGTLNMGDASPASNSRGELLLNSGNNADNVAIVNLNNGGTITAKRIQRSNTGASAVINWNDGTIASRTDSGLTIRALSASDPLEILLAETGTHTFDAATGQTITVESTAILKDKSGEAGTLVKAGDGQLTIESASTYTGTTTISAGTLLVSSTGSIASSGGFLVETNGTLDVTASGLTVGSGKFVGGDGTIDGNLTLAAGALFAFDTANTLTLNGTFSLDASFGVASLRDLSGGALDWGTIADNTYTLLNTSFTFNAGNISNFGLANAFNIGDGRSAYFRNGSLELVVIPEPSTWALLAGSLTLLTIFRRRRA